MFLDDVERDERRWADIARIYVPPPFEILTTGRWILTAAVADRFSSATRGPVTPRTLLPPAVASGVNTGIRRQYNSHGSWRPCAPEHVVARPPRELSAGTTAHRVAASAQTFARPDYAREAQGLADGVTVLGDVALELDALHSL